MQHWDIKETVRNWYHTLPVRYVACVLMNLGEYVVWWKCGR